MFAIQKVSHSSSALHETQRGGGRPLCPASHMTPLRRGRDKRIWREKTATERLPRGSEPPQHVTLRPQDYYVLTMRETLSKEAKPGLVLLSSALRSKGPLATL